MKKLKPLPNWMRPTLQGVTFWIGHRREFFRGHPLGEASIVAEVCNLIQANLHDKRARKLVCEVMFSEFLPGKERQSILTERARADLVVYKVEGKGKRIPKHIVEVKRASASKKSIRNDLDRLIAVKNELPEVRAYLMVISEKGRPDNFVNEKGRAITGKQKTKGGFYHVRRVCKASSSFSRKESAHYACVLEVFSEQV
ncbi:hypothetical protein [Alcanivorax sp.]|uniref:hypothetical protein n=1 Tax=Alcanivorax sp. TaxID=1872427 RepID=UPI002B26824A|nr:hypothetical protein [Alcanivorax sp.]